MSDYGDFCREMREHRQEVRRRQWTENQRFCDELIELGGQYQPLSGGLRFVWPSFKVDFWPSTGKWSIVGSNQYNQGPRKMVDEVKGLLEDVQDLQSDPELSPQEWAKNYLKYPEPRDDDTPPWEK